MSECVVELRGVTRAYEDGGRRREVLRGIDLRVAAGELVAIVGPSGCGKTTLLTILGALDADFGGEAALLGLSLRGLDDDALSELRRSKIGFVFQAFHLLEHLSVLENVALPLWMGRRSVEKARVSAEAALERVGLRERAHSLVRALSGGERQRVAIARAVVHRPRLILADEPTGNLDEVTGAGVLTLFDELRRKEGLESVAMVVATHDRALASRADRVFTMSEGLLAPAGGSAPCG